MQKKKLTGLLVIGMVLATIVVMTMPASATTNSYWIHTGEEISFMLYKGDTAEVYYYPNEVGNRQFQAWHTNLYYWDKCAPMSFYWTNNYGYQWNWWRNSCVGCYWPKVTQNLWSGSTDIGYKFVFKLYNDPDGAELLPIHVKIT